MGRATREEWAVRVARWIDSGLSAAEFGSREGMHPRRLTWWKWWLGSKASSKPSKRALTRRSATATLKAGGTAISPLTFVEMTGPVQGTAVEVVLPSGVRIQVRPGFDSGTLGRLLDVLEGRR
jgi:hypothetical protein